MVQQVQTGIDISQENTLETIEAVGTSSRKIIIDRQTRNIVKENSGITYTQNIAAAQYYSGDELYDASETVTLSDQVGDLFFQQIGDAVRIPVQGRYQFKLNPASNCYSATGAVDVTVNVKVNGSSVISHTVESTADEETLELILGKFDLITVTISMVVNNSTYRDLTAVLTITQL